MNALKQAQQVMHKHRDLAILMLHSIERRIALVFFFLPYLSYTLSYCGDAFLLSDDTGNLYKLIPYFCLPACHISSFQNSFLKNIQQHLAPTN